jgi:hypothetical protein
MARRGGTKPEVYMSHPRIRPFPTPTMTPGPIRNAHS